MKIAIKYLIIKKVIKKFLTQIKSIWQHNYLLKFKSHHQMITQKIYPNRRTILRFSNNLFLTKKTLITLKSWTSSTTNSKICPKNSLLKVIKLKQQQYSVRVKKSRKIRFLNKNSWVSMWIHHRLRRIKWEISKNNKIWKTKTYSVKPCPPFPHRANPTAT